MKEEKNLTVMGITREQPVSAMVKGAPATLLPDTNHGGSYLFTKRQKRKQTAQE